MGGTEKGQTTKIFRFQGELETLFSSIPDSEMTAEMRKKDNWLLTRDFAMLKMKLVGVEFTDFGDALGLWAKKRKKEILAQEGTPSKLKELRKLIDQTETNFDLKNIQGGDAYERAD